MANYDSNSELNGMFYSMAKIGKSWKSVIKQLFLQHSSIVRTYNNSENRW